VGSWFTMLHLADPKFISDERIVWVYIEGIPLHARTPNTFTKIGLKWGEVMGIEDPDEYALYKKRLCIKTKLETSIFESFKVIVQGKVYWVRAKEVNGWYPEFRKDKYESDSSDHESVGDDLEGILGVNAKENLVEKDSDVEVVSESSFVHMSNNCMSNKKSTLMK
ncbi:hypothetical protein Tco_0388932, partial [Tanacetum coccineum]